MKLKGDSKFAGILAGSKESRDQGEDDDEERYEGEEDDYVRVDSNEGQSIKYSEQEEKVERNEDDEGGNTSKPETYENMSPPIGISHHGEREDELQVEEGDPEQVQIGHRQNVCFRK